MVRIMKKALVAYASLSGNTEEVAEIIADELTAAGIEVSESYVGIMGEIVPPYLGGYDALFIGTYTWNFGEVPDEVTEFVKTLGDASMPVHVFATGETQFGDDVYCVAGDVLASYFRSESDVLKIEQSPRGVQEAAVREWVNEITKGRR